MNIQELIAILAFFATCVLPLYIGLYKMNSKVKMLCVKMGFIYTHWYNGLNKKEKSEVGDP